MNDGRKKPHAGQPLSTKCQGHRDRKAFEEKRREVNKRGWEARKVNNPPNGWKPRG